MYFPPYEQLLQAAASLISAKPEEPTVTLPKELFDFILQTALTTADFDEINYLKSNADIRRSLERGNGLTPHQHFIGYGYFEGRRSGGAQVDEEWYLQTYPDVADAIKIGKIRSAAEHFEVIGSIEGRSPSKAYTSVALQWKTLLAK